MVPWGVVGDQVVRRVLSDGAWAGLSRVVSSIRIASFLALSPVLLGADSIASTGMVDQHPWWWQLMRIVS